MYNGIMVPLLSAQLAARLQGDKKSSGRSNQATLSSSLSNDVAKTLADNLRSRFPLPAVGYLKLTAHSYSSIYIYNKIYIYIYLKLS